MNKFLMIGLMALVFSSCQSDSGNKEVALTPTPNGVPSASSSNTSSGQRPATIQHTVSHSMIVHFLLVQR